MPVPIDQPCKGGMDLTLLIAADTHCGWDSIRGNNRRQIEAMNHLPGRDWPEEIGGRVGSPRAVLLLGDLTENGTWAQRRLFEQTYLKSLRWPVVLGAGNHDRWVPGHYLWHRPMHDLIRSRHGSLLHSHDWQDLHYVCVGEYPDQSTCRWLARDLARVGRLRPVIIGMHYCLAGADSGWWQESEKRRFAHTIQPYNIVALVHGHHHKAGRYDWEGHDVLRLGSTKDGTHSFAVLHLTDTRLRGACYDWQGGGWNGHFQVTFKEEYDWKTPVWSA